jgi:hypothetical protein
LRSLWNLLLQLSIDKGEQESDEESDDGESTSAGY